MTKAELLMVFGIIAIVVSFAVDRITKGRLRTKRVMLVTFTAGLVIGVVYIGHTSSPVSFDHCFGSSDDEIGR